MRLSSLLTIAFCGLIQLVSFGTGYSQEGQGDAMPAQAKKEYELRHAEGGHHGTFERAIGYYLAPGWSKPRRMHGGGGAGAGFTNFSLRSGQPGGRSFQAGPPGLSTSYGEGQPFPQGGLYITALVLEKKENEKHAQVIVGRASSYADMGAMMGGSMGGIDSGMSGMSMGMGLGYGDMGGGSAGGMGGEMDGGMGGEMGTSKVVITPLDEPGKENKFGPTALQLSAKQLKNVVELVRLDCWIEEELEALRASAKDADKSKSIEDSLKELLSQEYEVQLSKQRDDIERLAEKLKTLQAELTRRASAKDRVVDVQLGQLVLEAQGLIGERP